MNQGRNTDESLLAGGALLWCVVLVVCIAVMAEGVVRFVEWLR